jgi:outer membrane protein TolC
MTRSVRFAGYRGLVALALSLATAAPARAQTPAAGAGAASPFAGSRASGTVSATPLPLSLKETIARGLQYNLGLLLQEESLRAAHGARWRALEDLLPDIHGSVQQQREVLNLEAFGFPAPDPIVGPFNVFDARVFLSQPVIDIAAKNSARAASARERAEANGVRTARDLVVLVAVNLYLQTIAASSRLAAAHAQQETAEALHRQAVDLRNAGLVAGIDVLRAQGQIQNQLQRTIAAENALERVKLQLARAIGLPQAQVFTLTETIPYAALEAPGLDDQLTRALELRTDYLAARNRVEAAEAARDAAAGVLLPSLRLDADYGAIGQKASEAHSTFRVAATVHVPIFEAGKATARRLEAEAELHQRQAELDDFRGRVEFEIRTALLDLRGAAQQVDAAQTQVTLAGQELQQARDRFAAGVAGNLEVTQAQEAVAAASDTYIAALYAHNLAKAALAHATGTIEQSIATYLGGSK